MRDTINCFENEMRQWCLNKFSVFHVRKSDFYFPVFLFILCNNTSESDTRVLIMRSLFDFRILISFVLLFFVLRISLIAESSKWLPYEQILITSNVFLVLTILTALAFKNYQVLLAPFFVLSLGIINIWYHWLFYKAYLSKRFSLQFKTSFFDDFEKPCSQKL